MTRLQVKFRCMAALENGSELQSEYGMDVFLSPTLINIFLKWIMSDALEEHGRRVSIGGRNITNLEFADDIDALAEKEQKLEAVVESLDKTYTRFKMEISA